VPKYSFEQKLAVSYAWITRFLAFDKRQPQYTAKLSLGLINRGAKIAQCADF